MKYKRLPKERKRLPKKQWKPSRFSEELVVNRTIGPAKPLIVVEQPGKVFRNGQPMSFPVNKYYTVDPVRSQFVHEITHSFHTPLRTNYTRRDREGTS